MKYKLRRCSNIKKIEALHTLIFPDDEQDSQGQHGVAHDELGTPVGFCSARILKEHNCAYFTRAGVLPCAVGQGLQKRMIHTRHLWAKAQGVRSSITYVAHWNHASIMNLLNKGFRFYLPEDRWAGNNFHYFYKRCI